jgi:hypothetical protein
MKKIFASALLSLLLAGCFGSGPSAEDAVIEEAGKEEVATPALEENAFVAISAEILCLPTNNPEATPEEIETQAKAILAKSNITEKDFNDYQQKISADDTDKMRVSYAIIGKMSDYCKIVTPGSEAVATEEAEATPNSSEDAVVAPKDSKPVGEKITTPEVATPAA